jgi:aromatic ring-opening dioxygenase catalytic subunit (LigB family)
MSKVPTLFIPHGGGPCFFMDWDPPDTWVGMAKYLRGVPADVGTRPKAVVVISGHWEEKIATIQSNPAPPLFYDLLRVSTEHLCDYLSGAWSSGPRKAHCRIAERSEDCLEI